MGQRFVACDREQSFLMPPDVREWLPDGHLAWFVIDAVEEMDLEAFYGAWMKAHGWIQAARNDSEGATAYFRQDGYQVFLTLMEEGGRTYATLIEAGASASSPTATVEISESP